MGCGASVDKRSRVLRPSKYRHHTRDQEELSSAHPVPSSAYIEEAVVTPRGTTRQERSDEALRPPGTRALRIDTAPSQCLRENCGLAITPVGKLAEEFRFFCPVCMMFFRSILETECCKQSICLFCLSEHIDARVHDKGLALAPADGENRKPTLPAGIACPLCAQVQIHRAQVLRTVGTDDDVRVPHVTSPNTLQHLAEISSRRNLATSSLSPLKIGDDFQTMALKLRPFEPPAQAELPPEVENSPGSPDENKAFIRDERLTVGMV